MNRLEVIIFCLLLGLTVFLRSYQLTKIPPSLNWDEVSIGYNAFSVLTTARDEWNNLLPLNFRAYGDYKLPGYIYADAPFIAAFGLNEYGVRLPSVLAGIGVVIFLFLIIRNLTQNNTTALVGMFVAATMPWLIIMSRIGLEANLALFLSVLFVYLFLKGVKNHNFLIPASVVLGLSVFTYNSQRLIALPLAILLIGAYHKQLKLTSRSLLAAAVILALFLIVASRFAIFQDSSARFRWTKILDEGAISSIELQRQNSTNSALIKRLLYNKVTYFVPRAVSNYLSHFSPDFLFLNGSSNYQYSVPGSGLLSILLLPFILIGAYTASRTRKLLLITLGWLLLAPIPAAVTRDSPHALRTLSLSVPLVVLTALGFEQIKAVFSRQTFWLINLLLILALFGQLSFFWRNYSQDYIDNYSWSWQYGYQQVISYAKAHYSDYKRIVFTKKYGEPHEFVLFYNSYNPRLYNHDPNLVRYGKSDWFWVDSFDKYLFVNDWEIIEKTKDMDATLLITSPNNYPPRARLLETVDFLDKKPAFQILRI